MELSVSPPAITRRRLPARWLLARAADVAAWTIGLTAAAICQRGRALTGVEASLTATAVITASCVHAVVGRVQAQYRGRPAFATFEEVGTVSLAVLASAALLLPLYLSTPELPGNALVGGTVTLLCMLTLRYLYRVGREHRLRRTARAATPVLLFGAGSAARQLVRSMLHDPTSRYAPVGLLDDDPDKSDLRVYGVPVLGNRDALARAVARTGATSVIFAVASAETGLIRDVRRGAVSAGASFKVLPSVNELLDGRVGVADVRDMRVSDLLGRHQIETDVESIAGYLTGKRVLVTGAGGSIGAELCRQIDRFAPSELMMLDRDESALHAVQLSLRGRALLDSPEIILADLRDSTGIREIFARRRPQVVFHAAALKHLPLLERYPGEAVKGNIWPTLAVLEACAGVERFVNISTDKAANPVSVLGYSKRVTERLTAYYAAEAEGTFLNVRFGNVLGSRGSVLTAFSAQIAAGGPVTVTHPQVTRYFMTVQEAVQLVIQAAAIGRGGEALVLEMGRPVRIAEVAQQMVETAPRPVEIVYTGLRPGEKLHEELFGAGERDIRPLHPLISHVEVPALDPAEVRILDPYADHTEVLGDLARLCEPLPEHDRPAVLAPG